MRRSCYSTHTNPCLRPAGMLFAAFLQLSCSDNLSPQILVLRAYYIVYFVFTLLSAEVPSTESQCVNSGTPTHPASSQKSRLRPGSQSPQQSRRWVASSSANSGMWAESHTQVISCTLYPQSREYRSRARLQSEFEFESMLHT